VFGDVGTGPLTTLPVIFYGEELVSSKNPFWGLFPAIERMQINEADFFFLPDHKVHGVGGQGDRITARLRFR
jgi:hypothetical protein